MKSNPYCYRDMHGNPYYAFEDNGHDVELRREAKTEAKERVMQALSKYGSFNSSAKLSKCLSKRELAQVFMTLNDYGSDFSLHSHGECKVGDLIKIIAEDLFYYFQKDTACVSFHLQQQEAARALAERNAYLAANPKECWEVYKKELEEASQ